MIPAPLAPELLYRRCDPDTLPFATTAELPDPELPVGQDRAIAALHFGIGIKSEGFNLYALGPKGTGKSSLVRELLDRAAAERPPGEDWAYVNNFVDPHRPRALKLPPGRALPLKKDMEWLIDELGVAIPAAFEGEDYRNRKRLAEEQLKERHEKVFGDLQKRAAERHVAMVRTPVGLALAPMNGEEVLSPEEFNRLTEEEKLSYKRALAELQEELEATLREVPKWEKEQREKLRELNRETARVQVDHLVDEIAERYRDIEAVMEYLAHVREDLLENADEFLNGDREGGERMPGRMRGNLPGGSVFRRYQINVVVDRSAAKGAPVVYEAHPTQPNLIGRIEYVSQFGALTTDFNLLKGGALHRANGGYLVLDALKILSLPFAWDDLKRALRAGEIKIESPGQAWGFAGNVSLEPEPIPLSVKVVLVGSPLIYYLLSYHDPEFAELFKVAADFDYRMNRDEAGVMGYARILAQLARKENLRPLDRTAVARLVEQGARTAGDSEKLSTHMASLADLVREANYWAEAEKTGTIGAAQVQRAVDQLIYRSDRVREHINEDIARGTLLIDTSGGKVGQVNGLAVFQLGRFAFGKPSRITCRVRIGKGEVIDIEREVQLGGPIHTKGVLILSSFLSARFAGDTPLSLSASLVFEQSYGGVDGDSASSTELYCLLSALADLPIGQNFAVTGSVDQYGGVQAIGGVNEKIEGFFDVCRARGLTGDQGVLIPAANVKHLMLRADVVEAAAQGRFSIFPVETIDQGIELLTGVPAGERDAKGEFPLGSVNRRVQARLAAYAAKARALAHPLAALRHNGNDQP